MRLLVTGAVGFIGSNFVRYWLEHHPGRSRRRIRPARYAGDPRILDSLGTRIAVGDIGDLDPTEHLAEEGIDTVVNFVAESHANLARDRPGHSFRTNVLGTQTLLEASIGAASRAHHISTCERGDLPLDSDEAFTDESP